MINKKLGRLSLSVFDKIWTTGNEMCIEKASFRNAEAPMDILAQVAKGSRPQGEGSGERSMQHRHLTTRRPAKDTGVR